MKAVIISVSVLLCICAVTGLTLVYAGRQATNPPPNTPTAFLESNEGGPDNLVIVFLGDSLTHAAVSSNFVAATAEKLEREQYSHFTFINAGINSELSYNAANRVDEVVRCDPDFVFLLIGTNDINAQLNQESFERYIKEQGLTQKPDEQSYRDNLRRIGSRLINGTHAAVAFLSLPAIGEDPAHPAYRMSGEYSRLIKDTSLELGVSYLPLFETMDSYLSAYPASPSKNDYLDTRSLMMKAVLRHYVFGQSWNRVGEANGFRLHTDFLHLNDTGAAMVADMIAEFIIEKTD